MHPIAVTLVHRVSPDGCAKSKVIFCLIDKVTFCLIEKYY
jgi:hypothetical protein